MYLVPLGDIEPNKNYINKTFCNEPLYGSMEHDFDCAIDCDECESIDAYEICNNCNYIRELNHEAKCPNKENK